MDLQYSRGLLTYIVGINYLMIIQRSEVISANYILSVSECEFVFLVIMLQLVRLESLQAYRYYALLTYCMIKAV